MTLKEMYETGIKFGTPTDEERDQLMQENDWGLFELFDWMEEQSEPRAPYHPIYIDKRGS